jgi:YegS/Rv2252/BmrU family lipid kinase
MGTRALSFAAGSVKVAFVVHGAQRERWGEVEPRVPKDGADVAFTEGPGDETRLARRFLSEGADRVVAVGGDGLIRGVAQAFFEGESNLFAHASLGILPAGSGNDLVKTLGIPRDLGSAWEILERGLAKRVDVGFVNGKLFMNIAEAGFGAEVVDAANRKTKNWIPSLAYSLAIPVSLSRFRTATCEVNVDGHVERLERTVAVIVANGRHFGGGMTPAPMALVDDGKFEVFAVHGIGLFGFIRRSGYLRRGIPTDNPKVFYRQGVDISVDADPTLLVEADGDVVGSTPSRFRLVRAGIQVVLPTAS